MVYDVEHVNLSAEALELLTKIGQLDGDEFKIATQIIDRLLAGQADYGVWDVVQDDRDYATEATEEVLDGMMYVAARLLRLKKHGG